MAAKILQFPARGTIAWHHISPAVWAVSYERSASSDVADRVLRKVGQVFERAVPASFSLRNDSVETLLEDATAMLHTITGSLIAELTAFATDAELLRDDVSELWNEPPTPEELAWCNSLKFGTLIREIDIIRARVKTFPDDARLSARLASLIESEAYLRNKAHEGGAND